MMQSPLRNSGNRYSTFEPIRSTDAFDEDFKRCADYGLFFSQGEVGCAYCSFSKHQCNQGTDYVLDHVLQSPYCVHSCTRMGMKNILKSLKEANANRDKIEEYGQYKNDLSYHIEKMSIFNGRPTLRSYDTMCGLRFVLPCNENMVNRRDRLHSLSQLPGNLHPAIEELADAGFFWNKQTNERNEPVLCCYYCNVTIDDWCLFRNPLLAHHNKKRACFHNILIYGDDFTLIGKQDSSGDYFVKSGKRKTEEAQEIPEADDIGNVEERRRGRASAPYRVRQNSSGRRLASSHETIRLHVPARTVSGRTPGVEQGNCRSHRECVGCKCLVQSYDCVVNLCCRSVMCDTCARNS